jgi:hypothetical protein
MDVFLWFCGLVRAGVCCIVVMLALLHRWVSHRGQRAVMVFLRPKCCGTLMNMFGLRHEIKPDSTEQIFVTGKTVGLDARVFDTILNVKTSIQSRAGILSEEWRLIFAAKQRQDGCIQQHPGGVHLATSYLRADTQRKLEPFLCRVSCLAICALICHITSSQRML